MTPELVIVNGVQTDSIPVLDRGFQYGDGLFETMAVVDGRPRLWQQHKRRLLNGMQRLGMPALDEQLLEQEIEDICGNQQLCVLKLVVTSGNSIGGYARPDRHNLNRIFIRLPWQNRSESAALRVCQTRLSISPQLAGMKHLNRLEQVMARAEWQDEFDEGVMQDLEGRVVECVMHNIFLVQGQKVITPVLDRCGVRGVMRGHVLALARHLGMVTNEIDVSLGDLHQADEIFITNAVAGIRPVTRIDDRELKKGPLTQTLLASLQESFNQK